MRKKSGIRNLLTRLPIAAALLLLAAAVSACGSNTAGEGGAANGAKVSAVATTGMIADIVREVGGEYVETVGIMKAGVDPHLYKASEGDIGKLDRADIIFYNGLHLEGKMQEILEKMARDKPTVAVSRDIKENELRAGDPAAGTQHDPHIWFNVKHWMSATEVVAGELSKLDPEHAEAYNANADAYLQQLRELDDYVRKTIASIPESQRVLVTAHDAFGYFGDAYGIKVMGLQGISTASEAGSKDVTELRDYLVANKIKAVFIESSVPRKAIDAVIEGAREMGHEIVIGGQLYSDAMGEEGTEEGTYIGMVRYNVDTIAGALK
ncbi:metal ABC transporter solute-binding protein, Zn/Mn family [Paenibacillus beijingensis]|uniref:Manganese transporter n=1 Tax=Paenibacillus beijingensis TaxID=1126833 RepID=A0A0D5NL03_9BACL|nr:zinc ABC transporter substrate-binding protein [Paenibacillus beijingensis]AJY75810.1 manganese transporter [Paenibacillus beijingensis]